MTVDVRSLIDPEERRAAIPALYDLRIRIFRGWPYLYEGTADYEADYLAEFFREPGAVLVVAKDGDAIVGAATASPMAAQKPEFQEPLRRHGLDVAHIFYFGEYWNTMKSCKGCFFNKLHGELSIKMSLIEPSIVMVCLAICMLCLFTYCFRR
jgi:hypothetical protein